MVQYRLFNGVLSQEISGNITELKQYVVNRNKEITPTSITSAATGVVTLEAHGLVTNDILLGYGSGKGATDGIMLTVTWISDDTFSFGVDTSTWNDADLAALRFKKANANEKGILSVLAGANQVFTTGDNHGFAIGNYVYAQNAGTNDGVYKIITVPGAKTFTMKPVNIQDVVSDLTTTAIANGGTGSIVKLVGLYANDVNTAIQNTVSISGAITGNVTGNVNGNVTGTAATVTGAAQLNITSVGTLTALQVDNLNVDTNTISATTGALNLTPAVGSAIVLDGTIAVDAGVVTGATSITSTAFAGNLTGNVTGTIQTLTGAGAVDITNLVTELVTTGANALTLVDGAAGQIKIITMKTYVGDGTLSPTNLAGYATITFNGVGDSVILLFDGTNWNILSNNGAALA